MRDCSMPKTEARQRRDFRNCRTGFTSKPWNLFSPRALKTPWAAQIPSKSGIPSCCRRRTSTMNKPLSLSRRTFLTVAGAALIDAGFAGRLFAAPPLGPRFLLVFLRGGYDSTNLLIPYSSSFYYESRPNIAIPKPDSISTTSALALDADWALAPAVRESIGTMYSQRQVAFVPFAGTEDLSRSHFETQDSIELGQPLSGVRNYRSGFLGRLSETLTTTSAAAASI